MQEIELKFGILKILLENNQAYKKQLLLSQAREATINKQSLNIGLR